ncbi:NAD-dependent protein deacylase [Candidatus Zixiibacteriota bacterium]|nr:NAD-dependent protein deacylase [candidate division Zixibacteria bacterium]
MIEIPEKFLQILKGAKKVAVLTGAGISAESGVPTFRGMDGLWAKFRPEELATVEAFLSNPKLVWEWYLHRRDLMSKVTPNPGHFALAEMEGLFQDFTLITQNIDGLHRQAGSKNLLEVHGNISRNKCFECGEPFTGEINLDSGNIPKCQCGGRIRPDVVWFGEMLPERPLEESFEASGRAEIFLSVGTSGIVYPAAAMPLTARRNGAYLVEINIEPTPLTEYADWFAQGKSGEILPEIVRRLKE